jgi:hypothetical protein
MRTLRKDGLIFLYQPLLAGHPIVGDAEFKNEAGGPFLQQRRVCLLQVAKQGRFDVVRLSNENPLPSVG